LLDRLQRGNERDRRLVRARREGNGSKDAKKAADASKPCMSLHTGEMQGAHKGGKAVAPGGGLLSLVSGGAIPPALNQKGTCGQGFGRQPWAWARWSTLSGTRFGLWARLTPPSGSPGERTRPQPCAQHVRERVDACLKGRLKDARFSNSCLIPDIDGAHNYQSRCGNEMAKGPMDRLSFDFDPGRPGGITRNSAAAGRFTADWVEKFWPAHAAKTMEQGHQGRNVLIESTQLGGGPRL